MEHRNSTGRQRTLIGTLLGSLVAWGGCTRGERAAPLSGSAGATASHQQQPSKAARPLSPPALGFDSLIKPEHSVVTCYVGARYVVVERELETQVGADLYVRPRGAPDALPRCDADSSGGDIAFRTGKPVSGHPDSQHFLGLKGDLLFAWDGTGASSDLYIYDLNKRAKVLMLDGVDESNLEWLSPTTVAIWVTKAYDKAAAAAGCPDTVPGNPPQMDSLMSLDLQTLVLRPTGRRRCGVSQ